MKIESKAVERSYVRKEIERIQRQINEVVRYDPQWARELKERLHELEAELRTLTE
jgi:GrpB-like predicted nucleotidyltransferase (UPF0157 family)